MVADWLGGCNKYTVSSSVFGLVAMAALLAASIYVYLNVYVCDYGNCKAFYVADERVKDHDSLEFASELLGQMYADSIWPLAFLGSVLVAFLSTWLIARNFDFVTFMLLFFLSFIVYFFILAFVVHHYVFPIVEKVRQIIALNLKNQNK